MRGSPSSSLPSNAIRVPSGDQAGYSGQLTSAGSGIVFGVPPVIGSVYSCRSLSPS
jgi:hypothetical protein